MKKIKKKSQAKGGDGDLNDLEGNPVKDSLGNEIHCLKGWNDPKLESQFKAAIMNIHTVFLRIIPTFQTEDYQRD